MYSRWPLSVEVIAVYSSFSRRRNFGYYGYLLIEQLCLNNFRMQENVSPKFTLVIQEVFPNFFPCVYIKMNPMTNLRLH